MSSERHERDELTPNSLLEPARRELTSIQIARRALIQIRNSTRRVLNYDSDESLASVSANITTEREYPYDENDYSLIAPDNANTANSRIEQTDDSIHSDSFDGSLFGLSDILKALNDEMAHTPERAPEALVSNEINDEILCLRNSLPRNNEAGPSRRRTMHAIGRTAGK